MDRTTEASENRPRLSLRPAQAADIPAIRELSRRAYPDDTPYSLATLRGQLAQFPQGQLVAEFDGRIVGYAASFRIDERSAFARHSWMEITGGGFAARHNPRGKWLYGMEVCVDPAQRGQRIGQRLYRERRRIARALRLKGIVFGARLPGLHRRIKEDGSAEAYVEKVVAGKRRDPTLSFQMRNGFVVERILPNYMPSDRESLGYACLMAWRNPDWMEEPGSGAQKEYGNRAKGSVRIGCVQYMQRAVADFDAFAQQVEYFVDVVADYQADFVVFPELFTLQLLSIENRNCPPDEAVAALTAYTDRFKTLLTKLALAYNINIIGGSHPTMVDGEEMNVCFVALRDGSLHSQTKIHPTPNERYWWHIEGGEDVSVIETDCGPIGVMICYDSEFPELSRHLVDQGALILFVPFCTDERQSYLRVRYCAQARAVENQVYVAMSGNVGNLPNVENMDIQYSQSCILTPCDFPFARDGVAADTTPNVEMVAIADLSIPDLLEARANGTVQNLRDRRFDLYQVDWRGD